MLNIETFKKFCMKASTDEAEKFLDYYITMENVILDYIKQKMTEQLKINFENKKILEIKDKQLELKDKQLEEKENELKNIKNLKYEEIHKSEYIYVFTTDKDNVYKIGKSINTVQRKAQLQTANVNKIIELYKYTTSNYNILESLIHYILENYRCHSRGEHFRCNIDYINSIISISGIFLDTLKSSYEYITNDELLEKLYEKLKYNFTVPSNIKITIPNQIILNEPPLIDSYNNINISEPSIDLMQNITNEQFNEYILTKNKNIDIYKQINDRVSLLNLDRDNIELLRNYKNIIMDKYKLKEHFNLINLLKTNDYITSKFEQLKYESLKSNLLKYDIFKIVLVREVEKYYNILPLQVEIFNNIDKNNFKQLDSKLFLNIKKAFDTTKTLPTTPKQIQQLYIFMIKQLTNKDIILISRSNKSQDRGSYQYEINDKYIKYHIDLHSHLNTKNKNYHESILQKYELK